MESQYNKLGVNVCDFFINYLWVKHHFNDQIDFISLQVLDSALYQRVSFHYRSYKTCTCVGPGNNYMNMFTKRACCKVKTFGIMNIFSDLSFHHESVTHKEFQYSDSIKTHLIQGCIYSLDWNTELDYWIVGFYTCCDWLN